MRIDRLYIRSFLASAVFACACLVMLFAFVYSTGFLGLGIICAAVLIFFACLYGWLRSFGFARRQAEVGRKDPDVAAPPLTGEENVKRLKV